MVLQLPQIPWAHRLFTTLVLCICMTQAMCYIRHTGVKTTREWASYSNEVSYLQLLYWWANSQCYTSTTRYFNPEPTPVSSLGSLAQHWIPAPPIPATTLCGQVTCQLLPSAIRLASQTVLLSQWLTSRKERCWMHFLFLQVQCLVCQDVQSCSTCKYTPGILRDQE